MEDFEAKKRIEHLEISIRNHKRISILISVLLFVMVLTSFRNYNKEVIDQIVVRNFKLIDDQGNVLVQIREGKNDEPEKVGGIVETFNAKGKTLAYIGYNANSYAGQLTISNKEGKAFSHIYLSNDGNPNLYLLNSINDQFTSISSGSLSINFSDNLRSVYLGEGYTSNWLSKETVGVLELYNTLGVRRTFLPKID
ncbi:MAG: hypothetical protein RJQ09_01055 [Cyclobacteriaceae bacterium]